jgi:exopolysaccharide biosynthesis WecB/TagA/CpsF family protein
MRSEAAMEQPRHHIVETVTIGGLPIAVLGCDDAARVMLEAAAANPRGLRPLFYTSANGEVIARVNSDRRVAALFRGADQILADGQPMVIASRWLTKRPLPERVATTDLFHDVARRASVTGQSFYIFGATADENARAVATIRRTYPDLNIVGASHGYLSGQGLLEKLAEIDGLQPDILWLSLGVPREQEFVRDYASRLRHVGVIKTSGGLLNFLSGTRRRAPAWMQRLGLEWAFRVALEPKRLGWRYFTTNPMAMFMILTRSE